MKKLAVLSMGVCVALTFSSCKSSESAYKKAYEKAKQQELAETQSVAPTEEQTAEALIALQKDFSALQKQIADTENLWLEVSTRLEALT